MSAFGKDCVQFIIHLRSCVVCMRDFYFSECLISVCLDMEACIEELKRDAHKVKPHYMHAHIHAHALHTAEVDHLISVRLDMEARVEELKHNANKHSHVTHTHTHTHS